MISVLLGLTGGLLIAPMGVQPAHGLSSRPLKLDFAVFLPIRGARMLCKGSA